MPHVGCSIEQRAVVKRWARMAAFFAVAGVLLSAFLIATGNPGGWVLLVMSLCIYGALHLFLRNAARKHPS
ncbi:hypothetical protein ACBR38_02775 [Streptomyces sp. MAD19A]|uniref:hypothetical protein n=1 Tax=Streptomyces TaxID=1883 RepID=UPI003527FAAC|nr:hypothetical protein OHA53_01475 [Streptomyces althioticus]